MIEPTVGRVVWYTPATKAEMGRKDPGEQPLAAIIAHVHHAGLVNLMIIDREGECYWRTNVPLNQDPTITREPGTCEWMPYQKGQAAKTEQLEERLAKP
jgi:hypothetical protein